METIGAKEARERFSELLAKVGYGDEEYTITRNGTPLAVLMPYSLYQAYLRAASEQYRGDDPEKVATILSAFFTPPETELEYGCVKCQTYHGESDGAIYAEHLMSQSKHGLRRRPRPAPEPDAAPRPAERNTDA